MQSTITVSGPDSASFLDSQLSQRIADMRAGDNRLSFVLTPKGRVISVVAVYKVDDDFRIQIEGDGETTFKRLEAFLFRVNCKLTKDVDDATSDETARISTGFPGPNEWGDSVLPHETGMVEQCVDFQKGCYVGQELVARIDSRGRTTKRLAGLLSDSEIKSGETISVGDDEVGSVTSVAVVDGQWIGMGYVKNSVEDGNLVDIAGTKARIAKFPLLD